MDNKSLLAISGAKIIALDKTVKVRIKITVVDENHIGDLLRTQAIGDITGGALVPNAMNESACKRCF